MARKRGRAFRKGSKRPVGWVRSFHDEIVVDDSPTVVFNLMEGVDWAVGVLNEMATIRRIHVEMIAIPGIELTQGLLYWALYVTDRDTAGINPGSTSMLDENILGLGIGGRAARGATGSLALPPIPIQFDVKAMRKVRDDQVLNLVATTDVAASAVTISGYASVLMSRGQS